MFINKKEITDAAAKFHEEQKKKAINRMRIDIENLLNEALDIAKTSGKVKIDRELTIPEYFKTPYDVYKIPDEIRKELEAAGYITVVNGDKYYLV